MRRILTTVVGIVLVAPTTQVLCSPAQDQNSAADLFIPAVPGLSATDFCVGNPACPVNGQVSLQIDSAGDLRTDASGWIYLDLPAEQDTGTRCSVPGYSADNREFPVYRVSPSGITELLGTFHDGCDPNVLIRRLYPLGVGIDAINGAVYYQFGVQVIADGMSAYHEVIVRISGLPTLLDILLSYQPSSTLTFNVPVHPEALPAADSFSIYAGDVETLPDLSQASPLHCTVPPDRAPVPGEHLSVPDTLPDPGPGDARYYLVAVNHQGETRAGREAIAGVLQGRNADALPGCQ